MMDSYKSDSNFLNNLEVSNYSSIKADNLINFKNVSNANKVCLPYTDRIRWILDNEFGSCDRPEASNMAQKCTFLGTTFPPNKFVECDSVRAKFIQEIVPLKQDHKREQKDTLDIPGSGEPRELESADSELFFDFDIGSPEKDETDNDSFDNFNHYEEDMELDHMSFSFSRSENTLFEFDNGHVHSPEDSITYQSTSSGLFSQPLSPSPPDKPDLSEFEELDEKTLFPEEWFKHHFNNACDDSTPKVLSPIPSGQDLLMTLKHEDKKKVQADNEEKKIIASDRLKELLFQLKADSEAVENSNKGRMIQISKSYSTSPANFSYLNGFQLDKAEEIKTISKSLSLYEISDFEKSSFCKAPPIEDKEPEKRESCEDLKEKYRKCSSLRSGKTPPSTPNRGMKIVRFADIFGLDLADVKTFLDEIPKVPRSAFKDLKNADISDLESDSGSEAQISQVSGQSRTSRPTLSPLFNQPAGSSEFFNVLRDTRVCLESACAAENNTVKGTIRVVNLDFNKRVLIRFTFDDWDTSGEIEATYIQGSCDGFSDKFSFNLDYSQISGLVGKRLQFCIRYECLGFEYWDNHQGRNYTFQVFEPENPEENSSQFTLKSPSRRSFGRRSSPMNVCSDQTSTHFSIFSHSPSTTDDPWIRY